MTGVDFTTISEMSGAFRARKIGVREYIDSLFERLDRLDAKLGAFAAIDREGACAAADRADAELAVGLWRGPLHGISFGAKDLLATADLPTEVGMDIFRGRRTGYDATTVARLRQAGAILIGKLNQTEGTFSEYHPTATAPLNPWDETIWPGASSSGPGVAVAARLCPVALASDTGGSIRAPSAACGITGLLPSKGRVSRHGAFPLAPEMDRVGPFARSAADCAHVLRAIAGHDALDPATLDRAVPDYPAGLEAPLNALRIGVDASILADLDPEVAEAFEQALDTFERLGARIVATPLPPSREALEGWVSLVAAGTALSHREHFPRNRERYGRRLRNLIELGERTTAVEMSRAIDAQTDLTGQMTNLHADIDAMLVPVSNRQTPSVSMFADTPDIADSYPANARFTGVYSLTGQPTITFPAGFSQAGLPIGLQLAGEHFAEGKLLHLAHRFQTTSDWHLRIPPMAA